MERHAETPALGRPYNQISQQKIYERREKPVEKISFLEGNINQGDSWHDIMAERAMLDDQANILIPTIASLDKKRAANRTNFLERELTEINELWNEATLLYPYDPQESGQFFRKVFERYKKATEQPIDERFKITAQFRLAEMHYHGWGVPINYDESLRLHYLLAKQEYDLEMQASAAYRVGEYYAYGLGILPNTMKALKIFSQVADQDYSPWARAKAKCQIALYWYAHGDFEKVQPLCRELVQQKSCIEAKIEAQYILANMHYFGRGYPKNNRAAQECIDAVLRERAEPQKVMGLYFLQACIYIESNRLAEGSALLQSIVAQNFNETAQALAKEKLLELRIPIIWVG